MSSQIFEKGILLKIFHNTSLQKQYLPEILPGLWANPRDQLIVFIMKHINDKNWKMNIDNILLAQRVPEVLRFAKSRKVLPNLKYEELQELFYDIITDITTDMFREAYEQLHDIAFARAATELQGEISYDISYNQPYKVLAKAKAITKLHKLIYTRKFGAKSDPVDKAAEFINEKSGFIRWSFSPKLNGLAGGWTRGYAGTLLGRSQHTKSTMMTLDSVMKALHNSVGDIDVILTEESENIFYQRVFAILLNVPITHMRNRLVKITDEHKDKVKRLLGGRLRVHQYNAFKDVIDLLFTLKSQFIWIDHINSIVYPGGAGALMNMIQGIPYLINKEVEFLKGSPESVIVNLSQVNEKELMRRTGRNIWKHPAYTDAYGSQVLHQHSREYLTVYYPYKDKVNNPRDWTGKKELKDATPADVYLKVEKSSFGDLAGLKFNYKYDFGILEDTEDKVTNVEFPEMNWLKDL